MSPDMLSTARLADTFPEPAPQPDPWSPTRPEPPYPPQPGPRQQVDRVDALSCTALAVRRIGYRCVCAYHEVEVRLAYWATDANLILHTVDEAEAVERGLRCGDTYTEVTR